MTAAIVVLSIALFLALLVLVSRPQWPTPARADVEEASQVLADDIGEQIRQRMEGTSIDMLPARFVVHSTHAKLTWRAEVETTLIFALSPEVKDLR